MKTLAMVALAAGVITCAVDQSPAGPQPGQITLGAAELALVQVALEDAQSRLQPALADRSVGGAVSQAFTAAAAALTARNKDDFRSAMGRAKTALASAATGSEAPIVETLQLVIALIEAFVLGEGG